MIRPASLLILLLALYTDPALADDNLIRFDVDVRPILSDNCFYCHGPDTAQAATELRLDQPESVLADLGGYAAVVPGDVANSELIQRILSEDPDEVMPPVFHRKKLSAEQKKILVAWVEQGAKWSEHWAFQKPTATPDPEIVDAEWPINFVDRYVLAELERRGIAPSPVAPKHSLLRRLSFDITGLPPSIANLEKFDFDARPEDYAMAVDRWLASPHFGERMAVYWLDLVRYADTVGYHGDQSISVSPYRDYVIRAFNSNMPFDRFTQEQIAGDLLENPTRDQLIASGYNRLGMMSAEGGVQPEEYLNKYASDRVRTTATAWLGITLGCAECHDHKFDPFPTKEFYEFSAFFADIKERGLYSGANESGDWGPSIPVPDNELPELLKPVDARIANLKAQLGETPISAASRQEWEREILSRKIEWTVLQPESVKFALDAQATIGGDGTVLVDGENPDENCTVVTATIPEGGARAFRLEALPHESLPAGGPGRAGNGNFVVTEFLVVRGNHASDTAELKKVFDLWPDEFKALHVPLQNASATFEQDLGGDKHPDRKWSAASAINHDRRGSTWGWAVLPDVNKPNELVVQIAGDEKIAGPATLVVQQYHGQGNHTLGHFRISVSDNPHATSDPFHSLPELVRQSLLLGEENRTRDQQKLVSEYFVAIAPQFAETNRQLAELERERRALVDSHTPTTLITASVPAREIRVLTRGNWMDKSGLVVGPSVPSALGRPTWESPPNRKNLAEWIASESNPLTARVFVNRIWSLLFGSGLAPVLDDFGAQSVAPSHPELLDRLAVEFVESGWDVKQLVRTIVMSQSYRQSSRRRPDLETVDPGNRLLARQSRFRLASEFVRDNALSASGLLVDKTGGRSVFPYQPAGLYRHLNFPTREYQASTGPDQYRRGLYTHWQRQYLHPAMKTFDAPSREECTAARSRSSTPLAALLLLNDPSYVEAAKAFADHAIVSQPDERARMNWIFQTALSRPVLDGERVVLEELLGAHREFFRQNPQQADELLATGQYAPTSSAEPAELAAWTSVCRAVINMHEFMQRN